MGYNLAVQGENFLPLFSQFTLKLTIIPMMDFDR